MRFSDKRSLWTQSKAFESMKVDAKMHRVSTIAIPKIGCGLDQTKWQEDVQLLRDVFTYADVQIVVYTLEENGVHAMSFEGVAEFYADNEIDHFTEEFLLENRELETDSNKSSKSYQTKFDEQFPTH